MHYCIFTKIMIECILRNLKGGIFLKDTEKDGIVDGTPETDVPETEEQNNNDLENELNELKDLFQQELDKAANGESDEETEEGELIQQLDETEHSEDESADEDRPICQCCEEKPCSDKYGEDYPYCDDCRKLMVKYPIRFSGVVAFLLTFVLFIGGCFLTQNELMDSLSVYEASSYYSSGHITTAADTYSQYLSSHGSKYISKRALREAIRTYYKLGATNEITDLVDKYYSDKKLDKETQEIYDSCIRINNTTDAVYQPIVMPALYGYVDPQNAIDQLNKFISENEKSKDKVATPTDAQAQPEYDTMIAEYFIYYIMVYGDFDNSERYEQIKKIAEKGGEDYIWMYAGSLSMMAAEMGELEVVESCCELIRENNLDDITAYTTLAHYYFRQKDIDADKILEICKQADEAFPTGAEMTHYRYYAAANLLKGEYDKALEAMEKLTASGVQNVSDANLYAVCGIAAGKDEVYDEMVETLANANFEISKNVDKYKAGKISIEKLFETAGGDFI